MIKKNLVFIFSITIFFFIILEGSVYLKMGGFLLPKVVFHPLPTAPPTMTPKPMEELVASPSAWADDEGLLNIEKNLEVLKKDLDKVDLNEVRLRPPLIDLQVEY